MIGSVKVVIAVASLAVAVTLAALIGLGVSAGDDPVTETISIARDGATSAEVEVRMGAGSLRLGPGATGLLEGTFTSSDETGGHKVAYSVEDGTGRLVIDQGAGQVFVAPWDWGHVENAWDLELTREVPISLDVQLGAGHGVLELGGLDLTAVAIETGAGSTTVDFGGEWRRDVEASIVGGAGDLTIVVPRDAGVAVHASVGLGEITVDGLTNRDGTWVNASYGDAPVSLDITVRGGVGNVRVLLAPAD